MKPKAGMRRFKDAAKRDLIGRRIVMVTKGRHRGIIRRIVLDDGTLMTLVPEDEDQEVYVSLLMPAGK